MDEKGQTTMTIGGVDLRELQEAHAQYPSLLNWRECSQVVIGHYVEANAALGERLRQAAIHQEELEQHIAVVEEENQTLRRELEPEEQMSEGEQ